MQALAILVIGGVVAFALWSWLVAGGDRRAGGRATGSGPLGLRSAQEIIESRESLEAEDLSQLLEACNARRRRRGERERTVEEVELELVRQRRDPRPTLERSDARPTSATRR